jgi:hypothetical protein
VPPGVRGAARNGSADDAAADRSTAADDLTVELEPGDGSPVRRYTLVCGDVVSGDHPAAEAACVHVSGLDDPFAPLPDDTSCTQPYGGPRTACVSGRWHGEAVDLELARNDGCRIAQWGSLGPLLPA